LSSNLLSQLLQLPTRERAEVARTLLATLPDEERALASGISGPPDPAVAGAETRIRRLVAELAQTELENVTLDGRMDEQGVDSLNLIVLRERLQEAFGVAFSDEEWASLHTPAAILASVTLQCGLKSSAGRVQGTPHVPSRPAAAVAASRDDLEIGMPLTGRNNLAETPLLQYLGDRRWRQLSEIIGVPSRDIVDDRGERLYATFFYVEVAFPPERPMAAFGENDRFKVISTVARYGTSMVDGVSYLLPLDGAAGQAGGAPDLPFSSIGDANAAGVPAVRLSNIFVRQFGGAEWLKKGRPAHPRFAEIPALSEPPDSYVLTKQAEQNGHLGVAGTGWTPLTDGPVQRDYRLIPDRDLNGAGLVYFANYPMFLDICERDVLLSGPWPFSEELVDRRTVIRRQSAYLNNASSSDTLRIEIEPWVRSAAVPGTPRGESLDLHLHVNCRMHRRSDNRLMMVSTVRKVVRAASLGEIPAESRSRLVGVSLP
jgi:probable biosynthetic protein (TIGR04098 family)